MKYRHTEQLVRPWMVIRPLGIACLISTATIAILAEFGVLIIRPWLIVLLAVGVILKTWGKDDE